jgi:hypothetical protein
METRVCSKCKIEKPLTLEYFGMAQKNKNRMHTECRVCKLYYMRSYQQDKRLKKDPDEKRIKEMYTIKEVTKEERLELLRRGYAHIYYEAFAKSITKKELKRLEGIEE